MSTLRVRLGLAALAAALAACGQASLAARQDAGASDGGAHDAGVRDGAADLADDGARSGWKLVWADEFNAPAGSALDAQKWAFDTGGGGWGNGELENYTNRPANIALDGKNAVITAIKENYQGSQYTSARLKTAGKFSFTYGRAEMRAVLPTGHGIWPAFWMLGANIDTGTPWPDCGEIDIMEWVGKTPELIYGTIHGPGYSGAGGIGAQYRLAGGFSGGFHTYAVEWEPNVVRWYVDDMLYETRTPGDLNGKKWVYDHDFFILLNLAIGGNFPGPPDNSTVFPQKYVIDYIRVYQRPK